jgi:predicted Zn-dependent peptidase
MIKSIATGIFSCIVFLLNAQIGEVKRDSAHGYSYNYVVGDPLKARTYTLKNGLTIIMSLNSTQPRVYTCIAVKAGSKNDPADNTGLAHYLEHMLFKGTDKYGTRDFAKEKFYLDQIDSLYEKYNKSTDPLRRKALYKRIDSVSLMASKYAIANEYDKMMSTIGATGTNAFTSFDQTVYINDIPANQLNNWIQIEGERFRNPVLRLFHTELEAVYEEKNISLDSDENKVFENLFASLFKNHTYGTQTTIGTVEHLKNPSLQKIRNYYYQNYVPNNMAIVMAGNFDPENTMAKLEAAFGSYEAKPLKQYQYKPESASKTPEISTVSGPESPYVTIGFRLPGAASKEAPVMKVVDRLLSNSVAGLFDLNLVKKQKLLSAYSSVYNLKDYSVLYMEGRPKTGQSLEEVRDLMLAQLDSMRVGAFDEKILKAIVYNEQIEQVKALESNSSRAFKMVDAFVNDQRWSTIVLNNENMKEIEKKRIIDFTNKYLTTSYSLVYKKQGAEESTVKIDKPAITPVEVNRNSMSHFVKDITDNEVKPIEPVFIDFETDIKKTELMEGRTILHVRNTENTLFKLYYVFEFGGFSDLKLPEAIELLKFLGTDKETAEQVSKGFYEMACSFNVFSANEQVYISLSGPDEQFQKALEKLEYLIAHAQPDKAALKEMVSNTLQDRMDAKTNKNDIRARLGDYARYGKINPSTWILSNKQLTKLEPEELVAKIHQLSAYPHTILYSGPKSDIEITAILTKYHTAPNIYLPAPPAKRFVPLENVDKQVYFTNYDMVQAEIGWTRNAGEYQEKEQPEIAMFNEYFGGGMSSIVFQTIRESKALAYSCYSFFSRPSKKDRPSSIGAYIGTQSDKLDSAVAAMNELLQQMPQSELLFNSAKASLKSQIEAERILRERILLTYLSMRRLGVDHDLRKDVYARILDMQISEVDNFHKRYFSGKPFAVYILGSQKRIPIKSLEKYGHVNSLSLKDVFGY